MKIRALLLLAATLLVTGFLSGYFLIPKAHRITFEEKSLGEKRAEFISEKEHMIAEMIEHEDYACCLDKPCTYCIEKTPGHGEGPTCRCLDDVVEGRHPCGECIGEILEGHGNRFLAKYFASAIAEEVGEDYTDTLKEIISDKYDIPVEEQI